MQTYGLNRDYLCGMKKLILSLSVLLLWMGAHYTYAGQWLRERRHILASMVAPRNVPIHPLTDYGPEMSAGQQFFVGRFEESITRRPNRLRFHRHTYYEVSGLVAGEDFLPISGSI